MNYNMLGLSDNVKSLCQIKWGHWKGPSRHNKGHFIVKAVFNEQKNILPKSQEE